MFYQGSITGSRKGVLGETTKRSLGKKQTQRLKSARAGGGERLIPGRQEGLCVAAKPTGPPHLVEDPKGGGPVRINIPSKKEEKKERGVLRGLGIFRTGGGEKLTEGGPTGGD